MKRDEVKKVEFDPSNGDITGTFKTETGGATEDFTSSGPNDDLPSSTRTLLSDHGVQLQYKRAGTNFFLSAAAAAAAAAAHHRRSSCG